MASDFIPPTVSQIRQVNVQLRANQLLPAAQLLDLCKATGVHEGTLKKVLDVSYILQPDFCCMALMLRPTSGNTHVPAASTCILPDT